MEYVVSKNVKVWQKYNFAEMAGIDLNPTQALPQEYIFNEINFGASFRNIFEPESVIAEKVFNLSQHNKFGSNQIFGKDDPNLMFARIFGENPTRIFIKDIWYDVIPPYKACRMPNEDGYYRFVYIQIDYESNEFYVGKVNRKRFQDFRNYKGSGLLFKLKYKKHNQNFVQYYIAHCNSQEESCEIEAKIVDEKLLSDPKCLNLVQGGGGVAEHPLEEERRNKIRAYNKAHPEQWRKMLARAHELYSTKNPIALKERGKRISEGLRKNPNMSQEIRLRIKNWIKNNPDEYNAFRERNVKAIRNPEVQKRKWETRRKWAKEHPDEWKRWVENGVKARQAPEARQKRAVSLRKFKLEHPNIAKTNDAKRAQTAAKKNSKPVIMYNLHNGNSIKEFPSATDAGRWLYINGLCKGKHAQTSICAVCNHSKCTTGYGYRKKAFGYGWKYK